MPCSHPNGDRLANQEAHSSVGFRLERNDDDIVAEPEVEFSDEEAGNSPAKSLMNHLTEKDLPLNPCICQCCLDFNLADPLVVQVLPATLPGLVKTAI